MWPFRRNIPLGEKGEKLARRFLQRKGMEILATNFRCPAGEADLIALDTKDPDRPGAATLAFVEVKTRSDDHYADPESAVNARKRKQVRKVADYYVRRYAAGDLSVRFDIVSIVLRPGENPQIRHMPGAF